MRGKDSNFLKINSNMTRISYIITTLTILIQFFCSTLTLDIREAEKEACLLENPISAIVENKYQRNRAFLFTGDHTWTLDIDKGILIAVNQTEHIFKNVTGGVTVGAADRFADHIFLINDKNGYRVGPKETNVSTAEDMIAYLRNRFTFDQAPEQLNCAAAYLVDSSTTQTLFVFENGIVYECYRYKDEGEKPSKYGCKNTGGDFWNPNNIEIRGQCEGLMIDEGPRNPLNRNFEIDNRTNYDFSDKSDYRILLADEKSLRYWKGKEMMYNKQLTDLFECNSPLVAIVVFSLLVVSAILSTITVGALMVFKCKRPKIPVDEGVGFSTITNTSSAQNRPVVISTVERTKEPKQYKDKK